MKPDGHPKRAGWAPDHAKTSEKKASGVCDDPCTPYISRISVTLLRTIFSNPKLPLPFVSCATLPHATLSEGDTKHSGAVFLSACLSVNQSLLRYLLLLNNSVLYLSIQIPPIRSTPESLRVYLFKTAPRSGRHDFDAVTIINCQILAF